MGSVMVGVPMLRRFLGPCRAGSPPGQWPGFRAWAWVLTMPVSANERDVAKVPNTPWAPPAITSGG